jgi:hypothetical protein
LVLYGGENVPRTPITDERQSLWLIERTRVAGTTTDDDRYRWAYKSLAAASGDGASPPPRVAHSQAAIGDAVYVFGGRVGVDVSETPLNDVWRLEVVDDVDADDGRGGGGCGRSKAVWERIVIPENDEQPEARSFHGMIAVKSSLYMFGGCGTNGRLNDLWEFDTLSERWTDLGRSHVLAGRGGPNVLSLSSTMSSGTLDDDDVRIAIVGGFAGVETNDGHVYSGSYGSWETGGMDGISEKMKKRSVSCYGSFPNANRCLIFGGEVDPSAMEHEGAGTFEGDFVILDGTTGRVLDVVKPAECGAWPEARGWADAAVGADGRTFYMFGGLAGNDANPRRLDDFWECKVVTSD